MNTIVNENTIQINRNEDGNLKESLKVLDQVIARSESQEECYALKPDPFDDWEEFMYKDFIIGWDYDSIWLSNKTKDESEIASRINSKIVTNHLIRFKKDAISNSSIRECHRII